MAAFAVRKDQCVSWQYLTVGAVSPERGLNGWSRQRLPLFMARYAIFHALKALKVNSGDRILVPSYICRAAVEPMLAHGAAVDFYRVDRQCRVDVADLEARITPATRAVLAVHYFGFPSDLEPLQRLCMARGLYLIEDCAHVLEGRWAGRPLGSFGDVSLFSWRKFLPVYDGADLVVNREGVKYTIPREREQAMFTLKVAKNLIEDALGWGGGWLATAIGRAVRSWQANTAVGIGSAVVTMSTTESFDLALVQRTMSRVSSWVKAHSDVPSIVRARRQRYKELHDRLACISGVRPFYAALPDGACPWIFPVLFDGMANAHLSLRQLGVPAVTWGGVRPQELQRELFPDSEFLYDHVVFLPIHQSLTEADLDAVVRAVAHVRAAG